MTAFSGLFQEECWCLGLHSERNRRAGYFGEGGARTPPPPRLDNVQHSEVSWGRSFPWCLLYVPGVATTDTNMYKNCCSCQQAFSALISRGTTPPKSYATHVSSPSKANPALLSKIGHHPRHDNGVDYTTLPTRLPSHMAD